MHITDIRLYLISSGQSGARGAADGESQYWGGGWIANSLVANPMSIYPAYAGLRTLWMGPGQDPYVIEIETDSGAVGFAANYGGGAFACAIIEQHFKRFLIGQDPLNIEMIWDQMNRSTLPYGLGGLTGMAMAGVDLALWDLKGKLLDQPVYRLIGGATKESIPCYVTTHPDCASHWTDRGFSGIKIAAPWGAESGREGILKMEALLRKLREDVGESMDIMVDCYLSWDIEFATRLAERVRDLDIRWFEDPLPNGWATESNKRLRAKLGSIQLATGNLEYHEKAFFQILQEQATDIIQPEIQWCGGLTPTLRIAAKAKMTNTMVIPHCAGVYNYHFVMSQANSPFAEFISVGDGTEVAPIFTALTDEPLPVNGRIHLDENKPGFGVGLNREILKPYAA
jgi:L-alanine-DL-glutamate epimerase-like enolase superfamily enzyme